mgnify:CR=1 FL=1
MTEKMTYICHFARHVRAKWHMYVILPIGAEWHTYVILYRYGTQRITVWLTVSLVCFRMVNKYKRLSDRQSWRPGDMRNAIAAVEREEMGWLLAAKTGLKYSTVLRLFHLASDVIKSYLSSILDYWDTVFNTYLVRLWRHNVFCIDCCKLR